MTGRILKSADTLLQSGAGWVGPEAVAQRGSEKKVFLKNVAKFTGKHLCGGLFLRKLLQDTMNTFDDFKNKILKTSKNV